MKIDLLLLSLMLLIPIILYFWIRNQYLFWKNRGFPYVEPTFPFGTLGEITRTQSFYSVVQKWYLNNKHRGPVLGLYTLISPSLLILDLDLIKNILIKDFNNFVDRKFFYNEKDDPLSAHLFVLPGDKWKTLRMKLSPTFTSGKMKFMFSTITKIGALFKESLENEIKFNYEIEIKEILARFTTDVIGTCAFGIECNSLKNPQAEFRQMGKLFFDSRNKTGRALLDGLYNICPNVSRFFGCRITDKKCSDFFLQVVRENLDYRKEKGISRNDFFDLLIKLKNTMETEGNNFTIEELAAQSFVFFLAGFETSSTTLGFLLFELACNQDIQEKLRNEVVSVLTKYNNEFTFDCSAEMKYLDKIIKETLRKYPVIPVLMRQASNDYKIPNANLIIPKGTEILIPVSGIHHDPNIYPNPDVFNPDRFDREEVMKRHSLSFLAFGDGPRNCIGLRFGEMQTKVGIVTLIKNFKFKLSSKTPYPIKIDVKNQLLSSEGGIHLKVEKI